MRSVDVDDLLDSASLFGLPLWVAAMVISVLVLDGLDVIMISLVAPALAQQFHVAPTSLGSVLAAALIGMAFGAVMAGPAGDRWGRKPPLLLSTALFAAATLLTVTSDSVATLTCWRFLTGVGLGGAVPNAIALLAEYMPRRWRNLVIAAAIVGVPIGGMLGATVAAPIMGSYGWRGMFVLGGLLPILAIVITYFALPESPRYLATRGLRRAELAALLNRISGTALYSAGDQFVLRTAPASTSARVRLLFVHGLLPDTIGVWLIFFFNLFSAFTFLSWAPTILTSLGFAFPLAMRGVSLFNLAGILGAAITAWIIAYHGSRSALVVLALVAAASLLFISRLIASDHAGGDPAQALWMMTGFAGAGFSLIGIQVAAYGLSAHVYPTEIRSSGVGWAAGVGRLGSITSTFVIGYAFARLGGSGLYAALSLVVTPTVLGALMIRRHMRGQEPV